MYAQQTLTALGIYDAVRHKAVLASDVRQVLAYVETGSADAGIVYATDAAISSRVRIAAEAPPEAAPHIVYPAAVIKSSAHPAGRAELSALPAERRRARGVSALRFSHGRSLTRPDSMAFDLAPVWISLKTSLAATGVALVLGVAAAEWRERKPSAGCSAACSMHCACCP